MDFLMTPEGWDGGEVALVQTMADAMGWASFISAVGFVLVALVLTVFATRVLRRRVFWCPGVGREAEVEFEDLGVAGFRARNVLTCSVFENPREITCRRACRATGGRVGLRFDPPYRIRQA